ncbi:MAG: hypothetical protein AAFR45_03600 [Pseudomonadota bacterium]
MRLIVLSACAATMVAACSPQVPDSAAGVGFDSSPEQMRARALNEPVAGSILPELPPISEEPLGQPQTPNSIELQNSLQSISPIQGPAPLPATTASTAPLATGAAPTAVAADPNADIAAETIAVLSPGAASNSGVEPLQASPANPAPVLLNNPGISDENDFGAVASRQTIESDAARIENQRQQRVQVSPTAVPERPSGTQPNIVSYALTTRHVRGQQQYTRVGINLPQRAERNCARYASADQAQIAFLEAGGPSRDRLNLDADGDGFACAWDPAPFRAAVSN